MTFASGGMIFIALFLIGGVVSGIRQGIKLLAALAGVGAALALTAGVMWWQ
ncbi:hypothetical protein AB0C10_19300 [Microbispora amethystogenes]|uniref:Amidotransferase n=1 Tax=Microbispora amethystogenes TaxID=1427754 RepID=A0ABQ4F611_9ACTN|nr:hypothetical protein [Microbispora amethystogenes]GIH30274.1 hypothetical protein Mam01_04380 [Microbispora amethystogenes]